MLDLIDLDRALVLLVLLGASTARCLSCSGCC
jgi:hypothetical protein